MSEIPETPIYAEITDAIGAELDAHGLEFDLLLMDRKGLIELAAAALWEARRRRMHFDSERSTVRPGNECES